jgi:hypothetical protein
VPWARLIRFWLTVVSPDTVTEPSGCRTGSRTRARSDGGRPRWAVTLTSPSAHTGMGAGSGSGLARSQARAGEGPATRPLLNQTLRNQDAPSAATSTLRRRALILASVSAADDSKEVRTPIPGGDHSYSAGQNIFERMAGADRHGAACRLHVPDPHLAVEAGGGQPGPVRGDRQRLQLPVCPVRVWRGWPVCGSQIRTVRAGSGRRRWPEWWRTTRGCASSSSF